MRRWGLFMVFACACGSSEGGAGGGGLDTSPAPTGTSTSDPAPLPTSPPVSDGGPVPDAGRSCPQKWNLLQYQGTWDKTKDVAKVDGGVLVLEAVAQGAAQASCESNVFCQPLRVTQEVTGDFDVSVQLKSISGTQVLAGPNSPRIPAAGMFVAIKGGNNYATEHAHASIRFATATSYDVTVAGPETLPGGSTQGDRFDVMPSGKFRATRTGNSLSFVVDFTEKGGGAGKRTYNYRFGAAVDSTAPVVVGLFVGANFTSVEDIDMKASFDDFTVAKGAGLVADDFACDSLP